MIFRHMEMLIRAKGEYTGIREMPQACGLVHRGISPFRQAQGRINTVESPEEMRRALEEL